MSDMTGAAIGLVRRDHGVLLRMIDQILAACPERGKTSTCDGCNTVRRGVCTGTIEQTIRIFVEMTLKHNLLESAMMRTLVPPEHRRAHDQAHFEIAKQLKEIRVVFSTDNNGIAAIVGIERVHKSLIAHLEEYDTVLEGYLTESVGAA